MKSSCHFPTSAKRPVRSHLSDSEISERVGIFDLSIKKLRTKASTRLRSISAQSTGAIYQFGNRGVHGDFAHRTFSQLLARWNLGPGRGARRMRQRDQIESMLCAFNAEFAADDFVQGGAIDEPRDGETTDRDYETRSQNFDLFIHPGGGIGIFIWCRNTIAAIWSFPRKTSAYRFEVNCRSKHSFAYAAEF